MVKGWLYYSLQAQMKIKVLIPAFCLLFQFSCTATLCKIVATKPQLLNEGQKVKHVPRMPKRRLRKTKSIVGSKDKHTILNYKSYPPLPNQEAGYVGDFWPRPRKPEQICK
jgi:hypothetical protein